MHYPFQHPNPLHARTCSHAHAHRHTHTHTHARTHTRTLGRTHARTQAHARANTHTHCFEHRKVSDFEMFTSPSREYLLQLQHCISLYLLLTFHLYSLLSVLHLCSLMLVLHISRKQNVFIFFIYS